MLPPFNVNTHACDRASLKKIADATSAALLVKLPSLIAIAVMARFSRVQKPHKTRSPNTCQPAFSQL